MEDYQAKFLRKPAIRSDARFVGGSGTCSSKGSNWNVHCLLQLVAELGKRFGNQQEEHETTISCSELSYEVVLLAVTFIVKIIQCRIKEKWNNNQQSTSPSEGSRSLVGTTIAVAIPEGPLLPLAVLAVHALNVPFPINNKINDDTTWTFAVLVPLEPGEGDTRIRHILDDIRATMILCLEDDMQLLEQTMAAESFMCLQEDEGVFPCHNSLYKFNFRPDLLNFSEIVQMAVSQIQLETSEVLSSVRGCLVEQSSSLQSLITKTLTILLRAEAKDDDGDDHLQQPLSSSAPQPTCENRMSHIVYTSGTTGIPKGCTSSIQSLQTYIYNKNKAHCIDQQSTVLLASSLSFDPCFSDILATFQARATLGISSRVSLLEQLPTVLQSLEITHVLCTPTLWNNMNTTTAATYAASGDYCLTPGDFPSLRVVALGGEPIPKRIIQTWAHRRHVDDLKDMDSPAEMSSCRLFATYGVTEACVYQTMGEVVEEGPEEKYTGGRGSNVGKPFGGIQIRICKEDDQENLVNAVSSGGNSEAIGEVVLLGSQLDEWSSYLNSPCLSQKKFVPGVQTGDTDADSRLKNLVFYRTGDKGFLDQQTGNLMLLGRIEGGEGMIKINGIRVELGEIETALVDDFVNGKYENDQQSSDLPVVVDAAVVAVDGSGSGESRELHAYCVLGKTCANELGVDSLLQCHRGVLCTSNSVLALLQARCKDKVRAGCTPSSFLLVQRLNLTRTGKRNYADLPTIAECGVVRDLRQGQQLLEYGCSGKAVAQQIITCLNLQSCQKALLTTSATFSMIGGDSLAATRIVRALYAYHHGVQDSRFLGGKFGTIDGHFSAVNLLRSESLGRYVDFLDQSGLCGDKITAELSNHGKQAESSDETDGHDVTAILNIDVGQNSDASVIAQSEEHMTSGAHHDKSRLYDALMQAISQGHTSVACALLEVGADPNWGMPGGRLSKVSGRNERKVKFRSGPMHLACLKGNAVLLTKLLDKGAKFKSPDASGSFPLQLAAVGEPARQQQPQRLLQEEYPRRLECVKLLKAAGVPLKCKDANKQTILHCAARSGNVDIIRYVLNEWMTEQSSSDSRSDSCIEWRDHWYRTPVHWAILNGHIEALQVLLEMGCDPNPPTAKIHKSSSVAIETPQELCERLHGNSSALGLTITQLLSLSMKP